jgi:uncharacterized protein YecT (DUF1311 family)
MRIFVMASSVAIGLSLGTTACVDAQKPQSSESGPMPVLSAADTITTCLIDNPDRASQADACIGQYSEICMSQPGGDTTLGMVECSADEYQAWDVVLNEEYGELRGALNDAPASSLQEAQRAWIELRDADCAFSASLYEGGTLAQVVHAGCLMHKTADRALEIMQWRDEFQAY